MRDVLATMNKWNKEHKKFALARVISTWGSAPRGPGASMLVSDNMDVAGSVSGGCIENSVIEASLEVLASGDSRVLKYGVEDEQAWSVGLSCGGQIRVLVNPFSDVKSAAGENHLLDLLESEQPFVLASSLTEQPWHRVLTPPRDSVLTELETAAREALAARTSTVMDVQHDPVFFHVFPVRHRLLIVGGADITVKLLSLASLFNFETVVVDPRAVFADADRFETAPDRIIQAWPQDVMDDLKLDSSTFAVLLTHDPKIDDPALKALLHSPAPYIGALGGRKTQEKRRERMQQAGFLDTQIERIRGPVGIDIDAKTPSEIALSILAEIIASKNNTAQSSAT